MKKALSITFVVVAALVLAIWQLNQLAADTSLSQWNKGSSGYTLALQQQRQNNKPILMFFNTSWCESCKALKQNVLGQEKIISYLTKFNKVQIDPELSYSNQQLADQYSVDGFPTLLMLHNNTRVAIRLPVGGKTTTDQFIDVCELALRKENT